MSGRGTHDEPPLVVELTDENEPQPGSRARPIALVAAGMLVVVVVAMVGRQVLIEPEPRPAIFSGVSTTTSTRRTGSTTTSKAPPEPVYVVGACTVFSPDVQVAVDTWAPGHPVSVPCTEPHTFQVTGAVDLARFDHAPDLLEADALYRADCRPANEAALGGPLDPVGRYQPYGVGPDELQWAAGRRTLWCGLVTIEVDQAIGWGDAVTTVGVADRTNQAPRYADGTCFTRTFGLAVCADPHAWEVTGTIALDDATVVPAFDDGDGWQAVLGERCHPPAANYSGVPEAGMPGSQIAVGWLHIAPERWLAGARTVHCLAGVLDEAANQVVDHVGPMPSAPI